MDSYNLPAWAFAAIERILRSNYAELALVVLNRSRLKRCSSLMAFWQGCNHWLYHVFNAIDEKIFLHGPTASTQVDLSGIFLNVPVFEVEPIDEHGEQHFSTTNIEQIKSYQLDVLVKMGFGNLRGAVVFAANNGIWTYRWGDCRKIEDGLTGFWEVVGRWPETGAALQQLGVDAEHDQTLFEILVFYLSILAGAQQKLYLVGYILLFAASS